MFTRVCIFVLAVLPVHAFGQSTELQALIAEVRYLRAALERTTQVGIRLQLLLHRFHQQRQVVADIAAQHEQMNREIGWGENRAGNLQRRLDALEAESRNTNDARQKAALLAEIETVRKELRELPQEMAGLRAKESELGAQRRNEEVKLEELERQLEQVENLVTVR